MENGFQTITRMARMASVTFYQNDSHQFGAKTQINRNSLGLQLAGLSEPGAVPLNMVLDSLIHVISLQMRGSCLLSDYALGFASVQFWDSTVQSLNTTHISSCNEPKPASAVW